MRGAWIVGIAAALGCLSPVAAQRNPPAVNAPPPYHRETQETYGEWVVESMGQGIYAASVQNDAHRIFGAFCRSDGCTPFLDTGTTCKEGEDYGVLINSPALAFTAHPTCRHVGKLTVLLMAESREIIESLTIGGVIGFATPMASGDFKVSRFSLTGSARAYARAAQLARGVATPPPPPVVGESL